MCIRCTDRMVPRVNVADGLVDWLCEQIEMFAATCICSNRNARFIQVLVNARDQLINNALIECVKRTTSVR